MNMSKQTNDWMEKLVKNYRIPLEEEVNKKTQTKKLLKESQLKKILERN
jgi:hypothetical protein